MKGLSPGQAKITTLAAEMLAKMVFAHSPAGYVFSFKTNGCTAGSWQTRYLMKSVVMLCREQATRRA